MLSEPFTLTWLDKITGTLFWERLTHTANDLPGEEKRKDFLIERYHRYCEDNIVAKFGHFRSGC